VPEEKAPSLPPEAEVPPIPEAPAGRPAETPAFKGFSVPVIAQLEKGKYYLQLRSYSKPELVESELTKIGKSWTLSVQQVEVANQVMYRIILGPVSKEQSQTLLQQFKNRGYSDAFVWLGK
jgi:hypothetical protein